MPDVSVDLHLIGPSLHKSVHGKVARWCGGQPGKMVSGCGPCFGQMTVTCHKGFYHKISLPRPDVVIGTEYWLIDLLID